MERNELREVDQFKRVKIPSFRNSSKDDKVKSKVSETKLVK